MFGFQPGRRTAAQADDQPRLGFRPRTKGEAVAQAQNQAPDSIPGMFKPGEFVLPPDTVHAMGGAGVLQAAVDATHTPAPAAVQVPRGFKPEVFFADGGDVEEQRRQQALNSPGNTFPGNRLQGDSGSSGMTNTQAARIAQAPVAAPAAAAPKGFAPEVRESLIAQIPTDGYRNSGPIMPDGSQDRWTNTEVGRNLSNLANALPGALGGSARAIARTGGPISGAINSGLNVPRALAGGAGTAGSAAASTPAAAAMGTNPAPSATPATTVPAPQAAQASSETMGPPGSAAPREVIPGVYRRGDSYADSAQAAALGDRPRGVGPSEDANVAAQNLASQYTARGFSPGQRTEAEQPRLGFPSYRAPTIAHSGNDWQARNDLRNAAVSASSIQNTLQWGGAGAENSPAMQEYRAKLAIDQALRQSQPGLEAEAMRQNGSLAREGIQQAGGLQREAMQQAGETGRTGMRVGIEQQRLQGEAEARGFKTRAQRQEEALRNTLLDPEATPQQKQQAQQSLRAIRGDADPSPWKVTVTPAVKNADGSTSQGSIIRHNAVTGEVQQVDGGGQRAQPPAKESLVVGQVYTTPSGQLRWNGKAFERMG